MVLVAHNSRQHWRQFVKKQVHLMSSATSVIYIFCCPSCSSVENLKAAEKCGKKKKKEEERSAVDLKEESPPASL